VLHPAEHVDLFKYSPTFAAFMAPFALAPELLGLLVWNLLNAAVLGLAIRGLPVLDQRAKVLMTWLLAQDFLTAAENTQSNALVAAFVILAFELLEHDRPVWAALLVAASFHVKIFGIVAAALAAFHPRKGMFLVSLAAWLVLLGLVPLVFVSPAQLRFEYASWLRLLAADHAISDGVSVIGWLKAWFGLEGSKSLVVLAGAALGFAPLLKTQSYRQVGFRLRFLASILIWMVIFNHRAESATYLIAMCGVALWYFARPPTPGSRALLALAFALTSLSPNVPRPLFDWTIERWVLKAVPCILIWGATVLDLVSWSSASRTGRPVADERLTAG
jgi:glycosyl transferase family 87